MQSFAGRVQILILLLAGVLASATFAREEVWEQELQYEARNRINLLIKGLDTIPADRAKYIKELVEMYKGKLRELVRQQLNIAVSEGNLQISQGIIEVYTAAWDTAAIPVMINELLYNKSVAVRLYIITHLPLFCVEDPTSRQELQDILESGERNIPPRLLAQLRSLPLDKNGKYNFSMDQDIRRPIETAIAWQLQPVEAVIKFGLEKLNQERALLILEHLIGVDLGPQRNAWVEFWRSRKNTYVSPVQDEIQRTQIAACDMLGAMGAECTKELADHCRWIMSTPFNAVRLSTLDMLAQTTELSVDRLPLFNNMLHTTPPPGQSEELWLQRQLESIARLRKLIYEFCDKYGSDKSLDIRKNLMRCLSGCGEVQAVPCILRLMRADIQSHTMRLLAAKALGRCSGEKAVRVLTQMGIYRGIAVKRELQVMEYQRVRAAFEALGQIIGKVDKGKLVATDPQASQKAAEFLADSLRDTRTIVGAPPGGDPEHQTVQYMARDILRRSLQHVSKSYDPQSWMDLYKEHAPTTDKRSAPKETQESN